MPDCPKDGVCPAHLPCRPCLHSQLQVSSVTQCHGGYLSQRRQRALTLPTVAVSAVGCEHLRPAYHAPVERVSTAQGSRRAAESDTAMGWRGWGMDEGSNPKLMTKRAFNMAKMPSEQVFGRQVFGPCCTCADRLHADRCM